MRIPLRLPVAFLLLLCPFAGVAVPEEAPEPVRVVSQTVGTDELLLALARPGQIAALSHLSRNPEFSVTAKEAEAYPQLVLGDSETILRHAPTLVLVTDYSRAELVAQIRRAGVRVMVFSRYKTLEDVYANLRLLAYELGAEARADALIDSCKARVAALRGRLQGRRPVRILAPSIYGMLAGADTTFQDLCDHAGAENVAATAGGLVGQASAPSERMLTWPIEMLVVSGEDKESALAPYRDLLPYKLMPSVREGRAVLMPENLLACVSHHRIDGYERLARLLHPEAFR
jgi:iron complex transport system substrate-binding protein